jgi:LysM repeat protein
MKKLFIILVLGVLTSCGNIPTKVKNPKEVTTVELQQLAKKDTTTYKVVEKNETLYVISTKDYTVVKRLNNTTGFVGVAIVLGIIVVILLFILGWILEKL